MWSFEQYGEICKYFAEEKQKDNNGNEVQKHLQLHDLSMGTYVTEKCLKAWLQDDWWNVLPVTGRVIGNMEEESPYRLRRKQKWLESSRHTYTSSWMPSWTFKMEHSFLLYTRKMARLHMMELHMALFVAPTGVGKTHLALDSLKREHLDHFNFTIILCLTLWHNETYHQQKWF